MKRCPVIIGVRHCGLLADHVRDGRFVCSIHASFKGTLRYD